MSKFIKKLLERKTNKETLKDKVEFLRKSGLYVSAIDKNDKYKDGYILGKMKDSHLITSIF